MKYRKLNDAAVIVCLAAAITMMTACQKDEDALFSVSTNTVQETENPGSAMETEAAEESASELPEKFAEFLRGDVFEETEETEETVFNEEKLIHYLEEISPPRAEDFQKVTENFSPEWTASGDIWEEKGSYDTAEGTIAQYYAVSMGWDEHVLFLFTDQGGWELSGIVRGNTVENVFLLGGMPVFDIQETMDIGTGSYQALNFWYSPQDEDILFSYVSAYSEGDYFTENANMFDMSSSYSVEEKEGVQEVGVTFWFECYDAQEILESQDFMDTPVIWSGSTTIYFSWNKEEGFQKVAGSDGVSWYMTEAPEALDTIYLGTGEMLEIFETEFQDVRAAGSQEQKAWLERMEQRALEEQQ